jgi:hypothetical protein
MKDREIDAENLLLHRIDVINCALKKANHIVIAITGYTGWLVTERLGLLLYIKMNEFNMPTTFT